MCGDVYCQFVCLLVVYVQQVQEGCGDDGVEYFGQQYQNGGDCWFFVQIFGDVDGYGGGG